MRHCEPPDGESSDKEQYAAPDFSSGQQDVIFGAIGELFGAGSLPATPSGPVPSSRPAGPVSASKIARSPKASTTSEPWFGGASMTMRPTRGGRDLRSDSLRRFDGTFGGGNLCFARARRHLFDGLSLTIATEEIHGRVDASGIAPQHPLDETHGLEVLAPVERGAEPKARDRVLDGDLRGRLPLMLDADDVFR